ncbi:DinB family protein [Rossellomorea sp. BNER]|uniref:DinB family protein n=1 Tax=Rossellomorea sp. BNER TaxID=2962031 RepID=UPI003AF2A835|nr:DinB family protein [Rossellomorea sp. BNER]
MNVKEIFIEQITTCYDESGWFVCLKDSLKDLTEEQASLKDGDTNSIWEIALHLLFYNERNLKRFTGNNIPAKEGSNAQTFLNKDHLSWDETVNRLFQNLAEWRKVVKECSSQQLEEWSPTLSLLFPHNAHHIGQIVHIRKQNGLWNSERGVH